MFDALKFDSYLIATGNFQDWMMVPQDFAKKPGTEFVKRPITSSSRTSTPVDILVKNSPSSDDEPMFQIEDSKPFEKSNVEVMYSAGSLLMSEE